MLERTNRIRSQNSASPKRSGKRVSRLSRLFMLVALLMVIPSVGSAGGGGHGGSACDGFDSGDTVTMLDSCFAGTAHFASAGNTITVRNDGVLPHTYTAVDGQFDSGFVPPGESFELTVDGTGTYQVFCSLHGTKTGQGMAGVLIVGADDSKVDALAAGEATPPQGPATVSNGVIWAGVTIVLGAGLAFTVPIAIRSRSRDRLAIENHQPVSVES